MSRAQPSIVVVEAYSPMGLLIEDVLTDAECRVRVWPDGTGAATFIRQEQPDVVILDLWLRHRSDGVHVLDQLWADVTTRHIPLIVLLDDTYSLPIERVLPVGQRIDVLEKPFALEELVARVEQVLAPARVPSHALSREVGSAEGVSPRGWSKTHNDDSRAGPMPI
jgi:DNA-binding response OmpR family regulator